MPRYWKTTAPAVIETIERRLHEINEWWDRVEAIEKEHGLELCTDGLDPLGGDHLFCNYAWDLELRLVGRGWEKRNPPDGDDHLVYPVESNTRWCDLLADLRHYLPDIPGLPDSCYTWVRRHDGFDFKGWPIVDTEFFVLDGVAYASTGTGQTTDESAPEFSSVDESIWDYATTREYQRAYATLMMGGTHTKKEDL